MKGHSNHDEEDARCSIGALDVALERHREIEDLKTQVLRKETETNKLRRQIVRLEASLESAPKIPSGNARLRRRVLNNHIRRFWLIGCMMLLAAAAGIWAVPHFKKAMALGSSNSQSTAGQLILRLHGSNTIGSELGPDLAEGFLKSRGASVVDRLKGQDDVQLRAQITGEQQPSIIEIKAAGSETAFTDLSEGTADIGFASRRITAQEIGQLSRMGNMLSPAAEHILGIDGVAIIVNRHNQINKLEISQLGRILSCDIRNWNEVGGAFAPIRLVRRNDESGTYKTLKDLVLGGNEICASAEVVKDSRQLSELVATDPNALGFIGLPYVGRNKTLAIAENGGRAIIPNPISVGTEEYVLSRRLFLYDPPQSQNPWVRRFIDFVLSPSGQALVSRDGFVGQNIIAAPIDRQQPGSPERYRSLTMDAERLSLDFRFEPGHANLDNKGTQDVLRLTSFLEDSAQQGKHLMLFGFADRTGNRQSNCRLAQSRADAIAIKLRSSNFPVSTVLGFCDDLPVGSNSSPEGRARTRRVEVWIR